MCLVLFGCSGSEDENGQENWAPNSLEGHELFFYNIKGTMYYKMFVSNNTPVFYIVNAAIILDHPAPSFHYTKLDGKTANFTHHVLFVSMAGGAGYYALEGKLNFTSPTGGVFTGLSNDFSGEMTDYVEIEFTMDVEKEEEEDKKLGFSSSSSSDVTSSSSKLSATVYSPKSELITERGFCWATTTLPTINQNKVECGKGSGTFSATITDLKPNTDYYTRPYAIYNDRTYYGEESRFKTSAVEISSVSLDVTSLSSGFSYITDSHIIRVGWEYADENLNDVKEFGICWGTKAKPTINDNSEKFKLDKSGRVAISKLNKARTYYLRFYLITKSGKLLYGKETTFQTLGKDVQLSAELQKSSTVVNYEIKTDRVYSLYAEVLRSYNLSTETVEYKGTLKKGKGSVRIYAHPNGKGTVSIYLQDKQDDISYFIEGLEP